MRQRCKCACFIHQINQHSKMSTGVERVYVRMLSATTNVASVEQEQEVCGCVTVHFRRADNSLRNSSALVVNHRYLKYIAGGMRKRQY